MPTPLNASGAHCAARRPESCIVLSESLGTEELPEKYITCHEQLHSGVPLLLGRIHGLILLAENAMELRKKEVSKEVGTDEIHWWIFNKEKDHEELRKRTELALAAVQKMKEDAFALKDTFVTSSYSDLIQELKWFCDSHPQELNELFAYVTWLHDNDVIAPVILFTNRVWGSTRLNQRGRMKIRTKVAEEEQTVKCAEIALGLRTRDRYTADTIYTSIAYDLAEAADPEEQIVISVPEERLLVLTTRQVLNEFASYFEFLRQSLRSVLTEIDLYNAPMRLLKRESFWKDFIVKASDAPVEHQLWDFKRDLDMWHTPVERQKAVIKFCAHVAAFANAKGGVLIIGVSNDRPRKVVGIRNLENRMKYAKEVIRRRMIYDSDFTHLQTVSMNDESGEKICLVIAVAQTKNVVSIRNTGKELSPIRMETGISWTPSSEIATTKTHVPSQNYDFIADLYTFVHDRRSV